MPAITNGLLALQAALEGPVTNALLDLEDGLLAIQDALEDPTTGLVGLNLARPQFGVFNPAGAFQGGTGPVNGADPPFGPGPRKCNVGPAGADGTYVVDFNNDVSTRMYSLNVFPGGLGAAPAAVSVQLRVAPRRRATRIEAGPGDTSHVLVKVGNGNQAVNGADFGGFSVTAISG